MINNLDLFTQSTNTKENSVRYITQLVLFMFVCLASHRSADAGIVLGGEHVLIADRANQIVNIFASPTFAGEIAPGFNLNLFVDDGGSVVGGLDNNAPKITSVNLKPVGGLFSAIPDSQTVVFSSQKLFQVTIAPTTAATRPQITANILLAQVTLDTTGLTTGNWVFGLNGLPGVGLPASDFAGNTTVVTNGTLTITAVPEPSTIALTAIGLVTGVCFQRRRKSAARGLESH